MPSFKEVYKTDEENENVEDREEQVSSAAASILSSHITKDKRLSVRVNSKTYAQFAEINSKLGATNGSIINTLIFKYIQEHKDILD